MTDHYSFPEEEEGKLSLTYVFWERENSSWITVKLVEPPFNEFLREWVHSSSTVKLEYSAHRNLTIKLKKNCFLSWYFTMECSRLQLPFNRFDSPILCPLVVHQWIPSTIAKRVAIDANVVSLQSLAIRRGISRPRAPTSSDMLYLISSESLVEVRKASEQLS